MTGFFLPLKSLGKHWNQDEEWRGRLLCTTRETEKSVPSLSSVTSLSLELLMPLAQLNMSSRQPQDIFMSLNAATQSSAQAEADVQYPPSTGDTALSHPYPQVLVRLAHSPAPGPAAFSRVSWPLFVQIFQPGIGFPPPTLSST